MSAGDASVAADLLLAGRFPPGPARSWHVQFFFDLWWPRHLWLPAETLTVAVNDERRVRFAVTTTRTDATRPAEPWPVRIPTLRESAMPALSWGRRARALLPWPRPQQYQRPDGATLVRLLLSAEVAISVPALAIPQRDHLQFRAATRTDADPTTVAFRSEVACLLEDRRTLRPVATLRVDELHAFGITLVNAGPMSAVPLHACGAAAARIE